VPHPARRIEEEIARIDKRKVFATRVPPAHARLSTARQMASVKEAKYPPLSAPVHERLCRIFAVQGPHETGLSLLTS